MKNKYSKEWKRSKQPRKQRKYRANAPNHERGKFLNAHLSEQMREKYGTRSLRIRKGDVVKIMRGDKKGEEGKVQRIDTKRQKIYLEGVEVSRRDGSKSQPPFKPSNLEIVKLDKTDQKRMNKLGEEAEPEEKFEEKDKKKEKDKSAGSKASSEKDGSGDKSSASKGSSGKQKGGKKKKKGKKSSSKDSKKKSKKSKEDKE